MRASKRAPPAIMDSTEPSTFGLVATSHTTSEKRSPLSVSSVAAVAAGLAASAQRTSSDASVASKACRSSGRSTRSATSTRTAGCEDVATCRNASWESRCTTADGCDTSVFIARTFSGEKLPSLTVPVVVSAGSVCATVTARRRCASTLVALVEVEAHLRRRGRGGALRCMGERPFSGATGGDNVGAGRRLGDFLSGTVGRPDACSQCFRQSPPVRWTAPQVGGHHSLAVRPVTSVRGAHADGRPTCVSTFPLSRQSKPGSTGAYTCQRRWCREWRRRCPRQQGPPRRQRDSRRLSPWWRRQSR